VSDVRRKGGASLIQDQRVKANKGAAGIDGQTIEEFASDEKKNLYKIWNRMSSGSYFPPAVMAVSIPKKSGGERILGIPTVSDRIAQTAVTLLLEPELENIFHEDSYGYRPGKSAHDALAITRKRCWQRDWVLEYDIRGLFDNINHDLLLKALRTKNSGNTARWSALTGTGKSVLTLCTGSLADNTPSEHPVLSLR